MGYRVPWYCGYMVPCNPQVLWDTQNHEIDSTVGFHEIHSILWYTEPCISMEYSVSYGTVYFHGTQNNEIDSTVYTQNHEIHSTVYTQNHEIDSTMVLCTEFHEIHSTIWILCMKYTVLCIS